MTSSWDNQPKQAVNHSYITSPQRFSPVEARSTMQDAEANISTKPTSLNVAKRTRSPPMPSREDDILGLYNPPDTYTRR